MYITLYIYIRKQDPLKQGLKRYPPTLPSGDTDYSKARSTKTRIETFYEEVLNMVSVEFESKIH